MANLQVLHPHAKIKTLVFACCFAFFLFVHLIMLFVSDQAESISLLFREKKHEGKSEEDKRYCRH